MTYIFYVPFGEKTYIALHPEDPSRETSIDTAEPVEDRLTRDNEERIVALMRSDVYFYFLSYLIHNKIIRFPESLLLELLDTVKRSTHYQQPQEDVSKKRDYNPELFQEVHAIMSHLEADKGKTSPISIQFTDVKKRLCQITIKACVLKTQRTLSLDNTLKRGFLNEFQKLTSLCLVKARKGLHPLDKKKANTWFPLYNVLFYPEEEGGQRPEYFKAYKRTVCVWNFQNIMKRYYFDISNCGQTFQEPVELLADGKVMLEDDGLYCDLSPPAVTLPDDFKSQRLTELQSIQEGAKKRVMSYNTCVILFDEYIYLLHTLLECKSTAGLSENAWKKVYRAIKNGVKYTSEDVMKWMEDDKYKNTGDGASAVWTKDGSPSISGEVDGMRAMVAQNMVGVFIQHAPKRRAEDAPPGDAAAKRPRIPNFYETYMNGQLDFIKTIKEAEGLTMNQVNYIKHGYSPQLFRPRIKALLEKLRMDEVQMRLCLQLALAYPIPHLKGALDPARIHQRNASLWTEEKYTEIDESLQKFDEVFVAGLMTPTGVELTQDERVLLKSLYCAHWTFVKNPKMEPLDALYLHLYDRDGWQPLLLTPCITAVSCLTMASYNGMPLADFLREPLDKSEGLLDKVSQLNLPRCSTGQQLQELVQRRRTEGAKITLVMHDVTSESTSMRFKWPLHFEEAQRQQDTEEALSDLQYLALLDAMRRGEAVYGSPGQQAGLLKRYVESLEIPVAWQFYILEYLPHSPLKLTQSVLWEMLFYFHVHSQAFVQQFPIQLLAKTKFIYENAGVFLLAAMASCYHATYNFVPLHRKSTEIFDQKDAMEKRIRSLQ